MIKFGRLGNYYEKVEAMKWPSLNDYIMYRLTLEVLWRSPLPTLVIHLQCDQKKCPIVYKSCPKMISLQKRKIFTPLQKIALECWWFGQINWWQRFYKVAQSPINRQSGHTAHLPHWIFAKVGVVISANCDFSIAFIVQCFVVNGPPSTTTDAQKASRLLPTFLRTYLPSWNSFSRSNRNLDKNSWQ